MLLQNQRFTMPLTGIIFATQFHFWAEGQMCLVAMFVERMLHIFFLAKYFHPMEYQFFLSECELVQQKKKLLHKAVTTVDVAHNSISHWFQTLKFVAEN